MIGARHGVGTLRERLALGLVALALLLRVMVPAGFMPATGQGYVITLCTGMGATTAWVDADGKVHKGKPGSEQNTDHPCAFAGFAVALDTPGGALLAAVLPALALAILPQVRESAIGRGLAAPPPPQTGPPARH